MTRNHFLHRKREDKGEKTQDFILWQTPYRCSAVSCITTPSVMSAEIYEIVREDAVEGFAQKMSVKVAVDEGNLNYEKILSEKFPALSRNAVSPIITIGIIVKTTIHAM